VGLIQEREAPEPSREALYEKRRSRAEALYELETGLREEGWPSEELVYDAEHVLYRFADGAFAFSRSSPTSGGYMRWALWGSLS
jgi:hypothetical protein